MKSTLSLVYHVGSSYGWSEEFFFKTPPAGEDWVVRAAIYGDMGNENAHVSVFDKLKDIGTLWSRLTELLKMSPSSND